jgi:N-carbamoylputrescine amidase
MKDIRIAAVVMNSPVARTRQNLDHTAQWVRAAKKEGAGLVCFPEMNITGYSVRKDIIDSAASVPGPAIQTLMNCAEKEEIIILAGLAENPALNWGFTANSISPLPKVIFFPPAMIYRFFRFAG